MAKNLHLGNPIYFKNKFKIVETIVFKFCIPCWNNLCFNIKKTISEAFFLHELKQVLTNFISLFHIIGTINIARSIES